LLQNVKMLQNRFWHSWHLPSRLFEWREGYVSVELAGVVTGNVGQLTRNACNNLIARRYNMYVTPIHNVTSNIPASA
jgi:hypothetical protein